VATILSESGVLPGGVSFTDNGNGTASLAGTPAAGSGGTYSMQITAHNGVGSGATQTFTLIVTQPLAITSASSATFAVGSAGSFKVTATGFPTPTVSESGALPSGVTFNASTGVLSGTPATGTSGTYTLHFTAHNGVGSDATQTFTLTVTKAAAHLAFGQQPTAAVAGVALSPALTVRLLDSSNNLTGSTAVVTVAIASGTTGSLLGTTSVAAVNGVATFSNLMLANATSYTLKVSSTGLTSATSSKFAITAAAASQVVFIQGPSNGIAGKTLGTVVAAIEDAYGNVETGDNSDQVILSVNSGPSTQLGGSLTATVQGGKASFSNLLLNTSGTYTLAAGAKLVGGGTLGPVVSPSFTVASPVSIILSTITYNSSTGLYSQTVTLTNTTSGTLTGPISLALTNLPSGVVLTDATGTTDGDPYVRFLTSGKTLSKGAKTSITLTFTAPSLSSIAFVTEVVVGL
jgi:hypothetical protein